MEEPSGCARVDSELGLREHGAYGGGARAGQHNNRQCETAQKTPECLKHVLISESWWNRIRHQRLGTWMLLDAVKLAMSVGIEKLVAEFVEGIEQPAINAARKLILSSRPS